MELTPYRHGSVQAGYKPTEVGVVPEEWEVARLGDLKPFVTSGSRGWASYYYERGDLFVRITNLSRGSIYLDLTDSRFVKLPLEAREGVRTQLNEHDVLISITADIGIVGYVDANVPSPAYINQHIALVRFDPSKAIGKFVSYFLASEKPQKLFRAATDTGAKAGMSLLTVQKIQTALPPLREQRAIAEALGDMDALLGALDRLIAKKRDLKQAAMQHLLTGQTRLPGFHGEWEETTFGIVVRHHAGNSKLIKGKLRSSEATGRFPAYSASGQDVWCDHFEHEGDAIVVSAVGSRCGKAFMASGRWCAIANTHVVWPNSAKIDIRLLAYFINDEDFWQKSGTGQPFVLFTKTFARLLRLPKLPEQTAIVQVLTEMDEELAVLEQRRDKTRALKQGMMQELLTGRTRLV